MVQKPLSIVDVAEHFLYLSKPNGIDIVKLQKLVYYAQSLYLVIYQTPLFKEDFEAWVHGPTSPELHYYYKKFGHKDIPPLKEPSILIPSVTNVLEITWKKYGSYTGKYLERKVFKEEPFQIARNGIPYYKHCNEVISKESMKRSYAKKVRLKRKKMEESL